MKRVATKMNRFSYSQALLALAIGYLAFSLTQVSHHIPTIVDIIDKTNITVDKVTPQIPDILSSVDDINQQVADVVAEVALVRVLLDKQVPDILTQVALTRPVVDSVITESQQYSQQLPDLMSHLTKIEQQIALLEQQIPLILSRIDNVVETTKSTTNEIALWRPHSLEYIEQIKHSRSDIPHYLTRAEFIVADAKTIGKEASSGLFVGLLQGALSLPFDVISGLTGIVEPNSQSAKNLTSLDISLMQEQTVELLNDSYQSKAIWQNVESNNRGTITKGTQFDKNSLVCHQLTFSNYFKNESEVLNELMCRGDDGLWKLID